MSLTNPEDLEAILKPLLLPWLASYDLQGTAGRAQVPAISLGQPSDTTKVATTGIECIISKTPTRLRPERFIGGGKAQRKEHRFMLWLWQPWQPELLGQGLTPKLKGFDADTGDGESLLDKIERLEDRGWTLREISKKQDNSVNPACYIFGIETTPSYCT